LSSWKRSFEATCRELEMARRKKQALDELLAKNRMSQPTYQHLLSSLEENIRHLEAHQRSLAQKMTKRVEELQRQIEIFRLLMANLEMRHVSREVMPETYEKNKRTLTLGLEATENELNQIRNALARVAP